jgi:hypothetical protein
LDKKKIADFLDSLCERPFADPRVDPAVEWQALSSHAALPPVDATPDQALDPVVDAERANAALAAILSGVETDAERRAFAAAASQSPAVRADAQSALAFLDGIEAAPQAAPAHLVERILGAEDGIAAGVAAAGPTTMAARLAAWFSGARRWRAAGACLVLLTAGGVSLSQFRGPADPPAEPAAAPESSRSFAPAALPPLPQVTLPVAPKSALSTIDPCPRLVAATEAASGAGRRGEVAKSRSPVASECATDEDRRIADRMREEAEALAAIVRAQDEARQAAAEEAAKPVGPKPAKPTIIRRAARPGNGATPGDIPPSGAAATSAAPASVGTQRPAAAAPAAPAQARPSPSIR